MGNYEVIKKSCIECSIRFNPKLMICKTCDPPRYRFCSLNGKQSLFKRGGE